MWRIYSDQIISFFTTEDITARFIYILRKWVLRWGEWFLIKGIATDVDATEFHRLWRNSLLSNYRFRL